jgi:hypothetical protein
VDVGDGCAEDQDRSDEDEVVEEFDPCRHVVECRGAGSPCFSDLIVVSAHVLGFKVNIQLPS